MERNASVIKTIQDMLRAGESEESIKKALQEMGINPEQAKKLISIAQADTMALLQSELGHIVREQLEMKMSEIEAKIDKELIKIRQDIASIARSEARGAIKELREEVRDEIKLLHDVAENQNSRLSSVEEKIASLREDLKELHMRRLASRNEWLALLLVFGALSFFSIGAYFLISEWPIITPELLALFFAVIVSGIAMLFSASVI